MVFSSSASKNKHQLGFTLVEILVSLSIFSIVLISTIGAFLKMTDVNKKIESVRNAMDNANLAMETMTRNLRLGTNYACSNTAFGQGEPAPQDCVTGGTIIAFEGQRGTVGDATDQIYYQLNPNWDGQNHGRIERTINGVTIPITSPDVDVQKLEFFVSGSRSVQNGDYVQPQVRIIVVGRTALPKNDLNFSFSFQTLATQRLLDS